MLYPQDIKNWQDMINNVVCGDCLDVMKLIPDKSVDLVITSPPYNMGGKSLGYQPRSKISDKHYDIYNDNLSNEEYIEWILKVIKECLRVSKYVFWNVQFLTSTRESILDSIIKYRNNLKDIFIWEKQAVSQISVLTSPKFATGYEFVLCFGEDNNRIFKDSNFPSNGYVPNIQTWYKKESNQEHHATFPVELPEYFIQYFCKEGGIILDPFNGTGTTTWASKKLKRNFIGIEISEKYCKIADERLRQDTLF